MSYDILVPLATYPDAPSRLGLERAIGLAATMGGRATLLLHELEIPRVRNALSDLLIDVAAMIADAEARSRSVGATLTADAAEMAHKLGLPLESSSIRCRAEEIADRVAAAARTHDVTILPKEQTTPADVEQELLFSSGGPVILVPATEGDGLDRVAIAWDNSRAAARAVRDALPILVTVRAVTIVTLEDEKPIDLGGLVPLVRFLEFHSVLATHQPVSSRGRPVGTALQEAALLAEAGLLVMGAYGHNRLREFVLGGATRGVLEDLRLPVLMSH